MKTIYSKISRLIAVVLFITVSAPLHAQVTVNLNVLPPYSPFFRDYSGITSNQVIVTLTSTQNLKVYMTASIVKDDNSVSVNVKDNYRPLIPINLVANIPQTFSGAALRNIYGGSSENDLILTGITYNDILYNQALPEGNYSFCIQVRDFSTGAIIAEDCRILDILYLEPPQITYPVDLSTVDATTPQFVLTSWTPVTAGVAGISYRLRIAKLIPGVTPTDALNNAAQIIIDKSNILTTTFPLDISSGIKLDTGYSYAMQVTASSSKAYFKNNGQSEPVSFYYNGNGLNAYSNITLNFINPNSKKNYVEAGNETNFLVNWNWFDMSTSQDTIQLNDTVYKSLSVKKYQVNIVNSKKIVKKTQKNVDFVQEVYETNNSLKSYLSLSMKTADSLGFVDSCWYQATVKAYDAHSQLISSANSVDFQYRKIKDEEPSLQIPVSAVIKYIFLDSVGTLYNATNTPVEISVLKKSNEVTVTTPPIVINNVTYKKIAYITGTTDNYGAIHTQASVPLKYLIGDSIYFRIQLPDKYYIDKNFSMLSIPAVNKDTSLSFGQQVALTYGYSLKLYVKKTYTTYLINEKNGSLDISLRDSIYNPDVSGYEYISSNDGMVYAVEKKKIAEGITVVLYRKNKKNYIPPIEGNISDYTKTSGFTEVARGVTVKESDTSTYVKFERLLASIFNGDEYYLIALNGNNYSNANTAIPSFQPLNTGGNNNFQPVNTGGGNNNFQPVNTNISNNLQQLNTTGNNTYQAANIVGLNNSEWTANPYFYYAYSEDGFVAQEMALKIPLPKSIPNDDSLYRKITVNYEIVSTKPPTSLVKGRLMYHWKSDAGNQLRPLANAKFRVVTDYLVNGRPIGSINSSSHSGNTYHFGQLFFVPEGQDEYSDGIKLLDHNKTMAVGETDDQGNFVVDVVNINEKGSLGNGYIVEDGWTFSDPGPATTIPGGFSVDDLTDPVINPDPGYDNFGYTGLLGLEMNGMENEGIQNSINNSGVSFNQSTNSFDVGFGSSGFNIDGMKGIQNKGHGPCNNYKMTNEATSGSEELVTFERVFRIVPENEYIYPTKETFVVQPFETVNIINPLKSYVKEVKVIVRSEDPNGNYLNQMKVTVFRSLEDKTADLPLGEGDGKYKVSELISPQYHTAGETFDVTKAKGLNTGSNVFTEKYELLWPPASNLDDGSITFSTLLAGFEDYYIESCSDPLGQKTYKATFASVNTNVDDLSKPEYFLGEKYPDPIEVKMTLYPLPSRALIRLLDNASKNSIPGSKGGKVLINKLYPTFVDKDGYVEFLANTDPLAHFTNSSGTSQVSFSAKATGYKNSIYSTISTLFNSGTKFTYDTTGDQFFYNFLMDPSEIMQGHIVSLDENKKGVPSYIKVDSGKVVQTDANGYFYNLPVPGVVGTKVFVIPKNVAYFDTLYKLTAADTLKQAIDLKDYGVYRRKHRIRFIILDKNYAWPTPIASATVQLGDTVKKTNNVGVADYTFENVSVNNFTFVIRGPEGKNYIPQTLNLPNIESKSLVTVPVKLETGSEVHGKVTLDGKPVKHAKVYIDVSQQQSVLNFFYSSSNTTTPLKNDANLVVAYTDASGNYYLRGVPVNNQKIYIHATLDTSFTVNGDIQPADIKNKTAVTNLALTSFKGMYVNNIYGFPLTVEKIVPLNADSSEAKVTGVVHWSKAISDFSLDEGNQVMRVDDVIYKSTTVNGKKVGVAQNASVTINGISSLKFRYLDRYNVKLTSATTGSGYYVMFPDPLIISKENDLGVIKGKINIVDNSFNFPSTYLNFATAKDNFYLAEKEGRAKIKTEISAVTSAMTETVTNNNNYANNSAFYFAIENLVTQYYTQPKKLYYLSNAKGDPIKFKLIGFDANANPLKSFIDEYGKIHLNVDLSCHITNAQPEDFSLNIEDMVLDENKVYPASSVSPIKLALEDWTLNIKDWSFSTEEGGIVSENGLINTKAIDIPFKTFVLRSDLFLMDDFQMKDLKMAGGNISLQKINDTNAGLVYDNKTGTDMKPHWRFCISGSPAAELPDLVDLNGKIKLNYIQILSNNESVFQLQQQSTPLQIKNNTLSKYSPESIYNGPNYISISGAFSVGAPRMADMQLSLEYKNPQTMKIKTVETDFEGQGFVHFVARDLGNNVPNIAITKDQVTILGNVIEKPTKTFNEIPSTFYAISNGSTFYNTGSTFVVYKVEMDKDFVTQLTSEGNASSSKGSSLKIEKGGMAVTNNDWSILTYEGQMSSNSPEKNTKPTLTKFAVMGDISASSGSLEVSNATPFGELKMIFDFPNKRLIGKITAKDLMLGTNKITGTIETLFDPDGFYIAGGCEAEIKLPNPYIDGTYNMGFMIGSYDITDELWGVVNSYKNPAVVNKCYRTETAKGVLKGIYFTLDRVIVDESIGFDFILASGYVQANAIIGADVWANFNPNQTSIGMSGYAYAHVAAGLGSITGTSISGSLDAKALVTFEFTAGQFDAQTSMNLGFNASISQSLVLTTISKDISIDCQAKAGTKGFDFDLGSCLDAPKCD